MTNETREQKIKAVRAILDIMENNPDLPLPFCMAQDISWSVYVQNQEGLAHFMRLFPDASLTDTTTAIEAAVDFGGVTLEARLSTGVAPAEWFTDKVIQELDLNKVRAAVLGPA